jgi:hypothetical protein
MHRRHLRSLRRRQEATVAAIVECLLPSFPTLDDATRAAVLVDVTRFVGSQIQALPEFLRAPYKLALFGFEWLPMVRWRHRFSRLDATQRAAYVDMWSESPAGALRNFMKLIRGCALLAYYDHPALLDTLETQAGQPTSIRSAAGSLS